MRSPKSSERLRIEQYRVRDGALGTTRADGNNGAFLIPKPQGSGMCYQVIVNDTDGWEHVSVVMKDVDRYTYTPSWDEMCYVKNLFWRDDETVVQYHPAKSEYVNVHENCLHLWKPSMGEIIAPRKELLT